MEQIYTPKQDYKVLVRCFTYNQSKYIEDALNGFAMQQTNFPFVCLIMDDCSTDGEPEVIKTWMERECDMENAEYIELGLSNIIIVLHKSNTNCTFAFYLQKRNLWKEGGLKRSLVMPWRENCTYEALCEGDDYWIDSHKLEKQVTLMDSTPDCLLCFTQCERRRNDELVSVSPIPSNRNGIVKKRAFFTTRKAFIHYVTMMVRTDIFERMEWSKSSPVGDIPLQATAFHLGKVAIITSVTAVYRLAAEGSWTQNMRKSIANARATRRAVLKMWSDFDNWSQRTHHILVLIKKILYIMDWTAIELKTFLK